MKNLLLTSFLFAFINLNAQSAFLFNGEHVTPGTKRHFTIDIKDQNKRTFIPVTVFHGKEEGPTLGIIAGVHGFEYSPILAGQILIDKIDLEALKGTIILVQAANVESFLGRSPFVNPIDGKNLNRSFPGNPDGTLTEQIAHFISTKIIPLCTHFVDAHSGDAPEDLIPYSAYYHNDNMPDVSEKGKEMAMHLGFDYIVRFQTTGKKYMRKDSPSLYCSAQAFKSGIPSTDIECGRLGMVEPESVNLIVEGLVNLMHALGMTNESPRKIKEVFISETRESLKSDYTGLFYPKKSAGDYVTKGMKIGYITDFFGNKVRDVNANASGVILYMLGTPPVNEGETLASISVID